MTQSRILHLAVLTSVLYVAAQIFADITSLRLVVLLGLSLDAGTLVYPFTFTLRDMVHKIAGASVARMLIFTSAGINIVMALLFWLASVLPPDMAVGEQAEFGLVLAPVFRIVLASIVAEVVANLIDTEVYRLWVRRFGARLQWGRVLASNAISVPVDSVIFVLIAFVGDLPPEVIFEIFIANVLVKGAVSLLAIPAIYAVDDAQLEAEAKAE